MLDTETWERTATFWLEASDVVKYYVRNDHMEFSIPYEYQGITHNYYPDFIMRLTNNVNLILETKGFEPDQELQKKQATFRWCAAVNNWNREKLGEQHRGPWRFHMCLNPQQLHHQLIDILEETTS